MPPAGLLGLGDPLEIAFVERETAALALADPLLAVPACAAGLALVSYSSVGIWSAPLLLKLKLPRFRRVVLDLGEYQARAAAIIDGICFPKPDSHQTRRWREMDSNFQFRDK